jgi:hypothetical protein
LVKVTNGDPRHSNHKPIIIDVGSNDSKVWCEQMHTLPKFEAKWLDEGECEARVVEAWGRAMEGGNNNMLEIQRKVLGEL